MPRVQHHRFIRFAAAALLILPAALTSTALRAFAEEKTQKTELNKHMEDMDEHMKKLRRSLRKPDGKAESLDLINKIEQEALASKALPPSKSTKIPEGEREKFITDYRKDMAALIGVMCQMESSVLDNDLTKAQELYKTLKSHEDKGHDKYMEDDAKKDAGGSDKK